MTTDDAHLSALRECAAAGFQFVHLKDHAGVAAIFAERHNTSGVVENVVVCSPTEAAGARFRADDYPTGDPLWQKTGTVEEVVHELLALPEHGARQAPTLSMRRLSDLWAPGELF